MKGFFVFALFFAFACFAHGQVTPPVSGIGKISGHVIDSANSTAIDYATIALTHMGETKVVNGATTDENGKFTLEHVAEGKYKITVNFLGYKKFTKENIVLTAKNSNINLGNILLAESAGPIKEITVSAEKSIIENKIDKLVFNVERDVTSQGGAALDILKKIPMVSVDVDGNVELQGNGSIQFLIDGKPSTMYGSSLTDVLKSIPASQIQSIEVVTSPGAKYDAEGTGGIINIILKKSNVRGINGNVNLTGGTRWENGSFNLNFKHDNFGARIYVNGNTQLLSTNLTSLNRVSVNQQGTTTLTQNGSGNVTRGGYDGGVGFDWSISPNDNIAALVGTSYQTNRTYGNTNQVLKQDSAGMSLLNESSIRYADNQYFNHSIYWNLNYKKSFAKKGQELTVGYNSSYGQSIFNQVNEISGGDASALKGLNPGTNRETSVQADYTHPFSDNFILETGTKAYTRTITSTSNVYTTGTGSDFVYDPTQSFSLNYNRDIYAAYASATFKIFNLLDVKAGGRYEYTHTAVTYSNAGNVTVPDYGTFVPSAAISHSFKDGQTIKLSYSHRIERPDYRVLNPFVNITDPKNITRGDPTLLPQVGDKIEAGYSKSFEKGGNINVSLFYKTDVHDIQSLVRYYPTFKVGDSTFTNVSVSTYANLGFEQMEGINIYGSLPVTPKLNLRTNLSLFNRYTTSEVPGIPSTTGINYRININGTYQFNKDLVAEFFGYYSSVRTELQVKYPSYINYSIAIRKQFWNEKASIALTANNIFAEYVDQTTETTGTDFSQTSIRHMPFRAVGINFTYKFGKLDFKKKPGGDEERQDSPEGL